jgi:hypothetical protein
MEEKGKFVTFVTAGESAMGERNSGMPQRARIGVRHLMISPFWQDGSCQQEKPQTAPSACNSRVDLADTPLGPRGTTLRIDRPCAPKERYFCSFFAGY